MNGITIVNEPVFSFVRPNYSGMSLWQRARAVSSTPPQLKLQDNYLVCLDEDYLAQLMMEWPLEAEWLGQQLYLVALAGMTTDLASIPRLLWSVPGFSPDGVLRYGALLHDPGYQYGYLLTPKRDYGDYPAMSWWMYQLCPERFGDYMPVFVGYPQKFFDQLLHDISVAATAATWVPGQAKWALGNWGNIAWSNYRERGPTAYGRNSLNLPGLMAGGGVKF